MKRLTALLLAGLMTIGLCACGSGDNAGADQNADNSQSDQTVQEDQEAGSDEGDASGAALAEDGRYPAETIKIGVENYDPTDAEFLELQSYFTYLSETLNLEFIYSEAITDAESEMKFIENCAISGCQAIYGYYNVSETQAVQETINYEMYYIGMASDEAIYSTFKDNPYYLGAVSIDANADYQAGYDIGKYAVDAGADKIVYASGGAEMGVAMFVNRKSGFEAAIAEAGRDIEVINVSGFPGDQFFADQSAALATEGVDLVCASFNGVDYWAQPIVTAGLDIKIATVGNLNSGNIDAFESGTLAFLSSGNIQNNGLNIAVLINAINGDTDVARNADGTAMNATQAQWTISSYEDAKTMMDVQADQRVYSAEELLNVIKGYNPDATLDTFLELVGSDTIEEILQRKGL